MTSDTTPRDEADLAAFLGRQSPLSADYDALDPVAPPAVLDAKILAAAKAATRPAPAKAPVAAKTPVAAKADGPPAPARTTGKPAVPAPAPAPAAKPSIPPTPVTRPAAPAPRDDDDTGDDEAPVRRRPRWLVPAALAASVLVAVGLGLSVLNTGGSDGGTEEAGPLGSMFAKRARERSEAEKAAAAAAAASDAERAELDMPPLPPPPVFEAEAAQVDDLDTAIALIRKELLLANQAAPEADLEQNSLRSAAPASAAGSVADTALSKAQPQDSAAAEAAPSVVQPRDRRLTKILELYDGGNPDLAADSLEIFLRDFEDDPISKRILDSQPKDTDVAVE